MAKILPVTKVVAENVKRLRLEAGLSAPECAKRLGKHRTWWNALEAGKFNPTLEGLEQVARLLKTTALDLQQPAEPKRRKAS